MVSGSQPLTDAQKNRANVLLSTRRSSPFLDEGASIAPTYHSKSLGPSFTDLCLTIRFFIPCLFAEVMCVEEGWDGEVCHKIHRAVVF